MMRRRIAWFVVFLVVVSMGAISEAGIRVIFDPWWPRPIVVAPRFVVPVVPVVPPRVPRPPVAPVGYIDFDVRPVDADVFVDGKLYGKANDFARPKDYLTLAPGVHDVKLSKAGFKTSSFKVKVEPGKTIELEVKMDVLPEGEPEEARAYELNLDKTGQLAIEVEPTDATIYIDDNFYGLASQFLNKDSAIVLRSGQHKIEVTRPGFKPYMESVEVVSDKVKELKIKMEKI